MSTLALVPVKDLETAKSRLAPALPLEDRRRLVLDLLKHTVGTLRDRVGRIVVVTPDAEVIRHASQLGVESYRHAGRLNTALEAARHALTAERLLIVLGDLPLLETADVAAMHQPADVVLAPDRALQGTNMMLLTPPTAIPFYYGSFSYQRHMQAARERGLSVAVHRSATAALDLDTPTDLAGLRLALPRCC